MFAPVRADPSENKHSNEIESSEIEGQSNDFKKELTIFLCKLGAFEKIDSTLALVLQVIFVAKKHVSCLRPRILFHFVEPVLDSLK